MPDYADSYEDVSMFTLSDDRERALLDAQTECCFMWTTKAGDPVGVIMNYVATDDRFWITCTKRRKRVAAVAARPRVALAITSRGTQIGVSQAVTYKGQAIIHDDDETKAWFYPALAARGAPGERGPPAGVRGPPLDRGPGRDRDRAGRPHRLRRRGDVPQLARRTEPHRGLSISQPVCP